MTSSKKIVILGVLFLSLAGRAWAASAQQDVGTFTYVSGSNIASIVMSDGKIQALTITSMNGGAPLTCVAEKGDVINACQARAERLLQVMIDGKAPSVGGLPLPTNVDIQKVLQSGTFELMDKNLGLAARIIEEARPEGTDAGVNARSPLLFNKQ